jgi:DNA gyrase/topoisomerase IV subunit B
MSCGGCKNKPEYSFSLSLNESQRTEEFGKAIKETFSRIFKWNPERINSIVDIAVEKGECRLFETSFDEMNRLSKKLAINKIPYKVKGLR